MSGFEDDSRTYYSSVLGHLFPISSVYSLPTSVDCKTEFSHMLTEIVHMKGANNAEHPMMKQAAMFTNLIKELVQSGPGHINSVIPSLHALQQCLRSGWQPDDMAEV